jgi:hypothetical protein
MESVAAGRRKIDTFPRTNNYSRRAVDRSECSIVAIAAWAIEGSRMPNLLSSLQVDVAIRFNDAKARDLVPLLTLGLALKSANAKFTPEMVQGVADLQQRLGLAVDGKIGRVSRPLFEEELTLSTEGLWPAAAADQAARRRHYLKLCGCFERTPSTAVPTLIGLRGVRLFGLKNHVVRSRREYDDSFVLLTLDGAVREFRGATHPYQQSSGASPDFNGDGKRDVGMIRPDLYRLKPLAHLHKGHVALHLLQHESGSDKIPAYRDVNQDGWFSPDEISLSETAVSGQQVVPGSGAFADEVLFHPGDPGFSSIGCQTAAGTDVMRLHEVGPLDYLLVNAVDAIALMTRA